MIIRDGDPLHEDSVRASELQEVDARGGPRARVGPGNDPRIVRARLHRLVAQHRAHDLSRRVVEMRAHGTGPSDHEGHDTLLGEEIAQILSAEQERDLLQAVSSESHAFPSVPAAVMIARFGVVMEAVSVRVEVNVLRGCGEETQEQENEWKRAPLEEFAFGFV